MKGYHHDERHDFSIRATEARESNSGDPATADSEQSRKARRQAERAAEVKFVCLKLMMKPGQVPGFFVSLPPAGEPVAAPFDAAPCENRDLRLVADVVGMSVEVLVTSWKRLR
jgi:hypothetical protein